MKRYSDDLEFVEMNDLLYVVLGSGDVAEAVGAVLVSEHGGHTRKEDEEILYYNGAADQNVYRDMYDRVIEG